jgi:hypothetical protein
MTGEADRKAKIKRVGKRLFHEFWIPCVLGLIVAVSWTYFINISLPEYARLYLANFIFAFLVVGWFTGHVVRVIRQQKVEDSLQAVVRQQQSSSETFAQEIGALKATLTTVVEVSNKIVSSRALDPADARALSEAAQTADTQATAVAAAANNSMGVWQTVRQMQQVARWFADQSNTPLPMRGLNPAIFNQAGSSPPEKPPPTATGGSG